MIRVSIKVGIKISIKINAILLRLTQILKNLAIARFFSIKYNNGI